MRRWFQTSFGGVFERGIAMVEAENITLFVNGQQIKENNSENIERQTDAEPEIKINMTAKMSLINRIKLWIFMFRVVRKFGK